MAEERGLMDSNHKVLNVESSIPIQGHSERDTPSDEDFLSSLENKTPLEVFKIHVKNLCEFPGYHFEPETPFLRRSIAVIGFATLPLVLLLIR